MPHGVRTKQARDTRIHGENPPMTLRAPHPGKPLRDSDVLPCDDGVPMETPEHRAQMNLLIDTLDPFLVEQGVRAWVGGNNFLYYEKGRTPKFCGPDFFVVLGRVRVDEKSYVVWENDGRYPDVIVELLSESTEKLDRGQRFTRYQDVFKTSEYYLYDPLDYRFEGFRLKRGRYQPIKPNLRGLECKTLGLHLVLHEGWLRWVHPRYGMLPTDRELAQQALARERSARSQADQQQQRADQQQQRAEQAEAELARLKAELERRRKDH